MKVEWEFRSIIFDLDGTLIDSAPGILGCFDQVLVEAGIKPCLPLSDKLIGPPLRQVMTMLTGIDSVTELDRLVARFRDAYDSGGYRIIRVYDGIEEMLAMLYSRNVTMAIATNKRLVPTIKIVEYLGWQRYFPCIGTLDMQSPPHPHKAALIGYLLGKLDMDTETSLYVGDKWEDGEAAQANEIPFIAAGWGYGEWDESDLPSGWTVLSSSSELTGIANLDAFPNIFVEPIARGIKSI